MSIIYVMAGIGVVVVVALVAVGRFGQMEEPPTDRPGPSLPETPLIIEDIDNVRFTVGFRGYRMDQVDAVITRLTFEIQQRDATISALRQPFSPEVTDEEPPPSDETGPFATTVE